MGSGKTSFARSLGELGAVVVDADGMGHQLLRNPGIKRAVVNAFGVDVLDHTGQINRKAVARIVFRDEKKLRLLNRLLHPAIIDGIRCKVAEWRSRRCAGLLVLDAPLLFEAGLEELCDEIVFVAAPREECARRLRRRRHWSGQEAARRKLFQHTASWKAAHSDIIIDNGGSERELIEKAKSFWRKRMCAG